MKRQQALHRSSLLKDAKDVDCYFSILRSLSIPGGEADLAKRRDEARKLKYLALGHQSNSFFEVAIGFYLESAKKYGDFETEVLEGLSECFEELGNVYCAAAICIILLNRVGTSTLGRLVTAYNDLGYSLNKDEANPGLRQLSKKDRDECFNRLVEPRPNFKTSPEILLEVLFFTGHISCFYNDIFKDSQVESYRKRLVKSIEQIEPGKTTILSECLKFFRSKSFGSLTPIEICALEEVVVFLSEFRLHTEEVLFFKLAESLGSDEFIGRALQLNPGSIERLLHKLFESLGDFIASDEGNRRFSARSSPAAFLGDIFWYVHTTRNVLLADWKYSRDMTKSWSAKIAADMIHGLKDEYLSKDKRFHNKMLSMPTESLLQILAELSVISAANFVEWKETCLLPAASTPAVSRSWTGEKMFEQFATFWRNLIGTLIQRGQVVLAMQEPAVWLHLASRLEFAASNFNRLSSLGRMALDDYVGTFYVPFIAYWKIGDLKSLAASNEFLEAFTKAFVCVLPLQDTSRLDSQYSILPAALSFCLATEKNGVSSFITNHVTKACGGSFLGVIDLLKSSHQTNGGCNALRVLSLVLKAASANQVEAEQIRAVKANLVLDLFEENLAAMTSFSTRSDTCLMLSVLLTIIAILGPVGKAPVNSLISQAQLEAMLLKKTTSCKDVAEKLGTIIASKRREIPATKCRSVAIAAAIVMARLVERDAKFKAELRRAGSLTRVISSLRDNLKLISNDECVKADMTK